MVKVETKRELALQQIAYRVGQAVKIAVGDGDGNSG